MTTRNDEEAGHTPGPEAAGDPVAQGLTQGTFADLGLSEPVLRALAEMGFEAPMAVQAQTIPVARTGKDLLVQSRTGSGKTAAFGIPLVDALVSDEGFVQAIILLPTRELALQVSTELARIATHKGVTVVPVYGGAPMGRQVEQLKAGAQIVCGTPGRVLDHLRRRTLNLGKVRCAVLDECDEMLSMGFQEDIERILEHTPETRQTLLFSATLPEGIQRLARRFLTNPVHLKLSADFVGVHEIQHVYYPVGAASREQELVRVLEFENPGRAIVFCNTRDEVGRVAEFLKRQGYSADAISSDLSQADRERVMGAMRQGALRFLVATDVAARGIDLDAITHVFNYSFPDSPEVYIHRTGRTGRAGRHGIAVSLIGPTEVGTFYYLKLLYKIKPEERSLPSPIEIRSRREGEHVAALRHRFAREPGQQWRSLAKRILSAIDAEKLLAGMLREVLTEATDETADALPRATVPPTPEPEAALAPVGERSPDDRPEPGNRPMGGQRPHDGRGGERGGRYERDRGERYGERREGRGRPRGEEREGRWGRERGERPERRDRFDRGRDRDRRPGRQSEENGESRENRDGRENQEFRGDRGDAEAGPRVSNDGAHGPTSNGEGPVRDAREGGDFDAVWREEAGAEGGRPGAASNGRDERPEADAVSPDRGRASEVPAPGTTRLYLNLGRKDGMNVEGVAALTAEAGFPVPAGNIDVMNTHSYLNVPDEVVAGLTGALAGREIAGRTVMCEPAKPRRR